jgi:hypothetical protein
MTTNGDSIVVYSDTEATGGIVYAKRHTQASGWSVVEKIYSLTGITLFPQVAMDGGGNAVALWGQTAGAVVDMASNNYVAGQGWSTAQLIESSIGTIAGNPWWLVAMDGSGNAFAVWIQADGGNIPSVYASRGN